MEPQYQNISPAPPTKRTSSRFSRKTILFIGAIAAALIVALSLFILSNQNRPLSQMQRLSARFESLQTITAQGAKHVQNADLKKVHSDALILVSGNTVAINTAMQKAGLEKIPKEITALESDTTTLDTLNDAQLNGRFDDAYKKALSQKLESTMALMSEVNDKTNNKELKTALSTGYSHFGGLLDQLAAL